MKTNEKSTSALLKRLTSIRRMVKFFVIRLDVIELFSIMLVELSFIWTVRFIKTANVLFHCFVGGFFFSSIFEKI